MSQLLHCRKCGASFTMPEVVSAETKAEVAALVRVSLQHIAAMKFWRDATGTNIADAKATIMHITTQKGCCHQCGRVLDGADAEMSDCFYCGSLNLDW